MTLRRPDEASILRFCFSGFNLKTIAACILLGIGAHYAQSSRITIVEQSRSAQKDRMDELEKRMDVQREALQKLRDSKVELSTYLADQRILSEELRAIQDSEGRIETILMQQHEPRR